MLESIVRRDFLPRGVGTVTKAPLLLHLINTPLEDRERGDGPSKKNFNFLHIKGTRIYYGKFILNFSELTIVFSMDDYLYMTLVLMFFEKINFSNFFNFYRGTRIYLQKTF